MCFTRKYLNWIVYSMNIYSRGIFERMKVILIKETCKSKEGEERYSNPSSPQIIASDASWVCNDFRRRCTPGAGAHMVEKDSSSRRWRRRITENRHEWLAAAKCGGERGLSRRARRNDCRAASTLLGSGRLYHPGAGAISSPWRSKMAAACRRRLRSHSARRRAVRVRSQQRFSKLTRRQRQQQIERRIARDRGNALPLRAWNTVSASGNVMSHVTTPL